MGVLSPSRQLDPQPDEIESIDPAPVLMKFTFTGFKQDGDARIYSFDGVTEDRVRTHFTVRVDLALSRRMGLRLQEIPLLCVTVLERRTGEERNLVFTEEAMVVCIQEATAAQEAEAAKNAPKRRVKAEVVEEDDPYASAPMPNPYRQW